MRRAWVTRISGVLCGAKRMSSWVAFLWLANFSGVRFTAFGPGEFGQCSLGFGDAHFPALSVAFFAPGASGDHMPLALVFDLHEAVGVAEFGLPSVGQFFEQGFEGGVGEPGDKVHAFGIKGGQVDFAVHSSVENKDGLGHGKTTTQEFQQALQGGGVGAVAPEHREVKGHSVRVGEDHSFVSAKTISVTKRLKDSFSTNCL